MSLVTGQISKNIWYVYLRSDCVYPQRLFLQLIQCFVEYLLLHGVRYMVEREIEREKERTLQGLLFLINSKESFICTISQNSTATPEREMK